MNYSDELMTFLEHFSDAMLVTDKNMVITAVTPNCFGSFGLRPEDVLGKKVTELEEEGTHFPSASPISYRERRRVTILQTTQLGRTMLVTSTPVFDDDGEITRIVSCITDVTELLEFRDSGMHGRTFIKGVDPESTRLYPLNIVSNSSAMKKALQIVSSVADLDCNILITGESGTGKEVIAKQIHMQSERRNNSFVHINCGSIPETLLESELFGYDSGAFTGARKQGKPGMFELANNGTLFLDEIGEMPLSLQVKILLAIQDRQIYRLGGTKPIGVNCRVIAATNKDLNREIEEGRFREDLYYRLNVVRINLPPLRQRRADIAPLINLMMDAFGKKYNKHPLLPGSLMKFFQNYDWPGNVRELSNVVERLIIFSDGKAISEADVSDCLPSKIGCGDRCEEVMDKEELLPLKEAVEKEERRLLALAQKQYGSTAKVAKALDIDQATAFRKMRKYGML